MRLRDARDEEIRRGRGAGGSWSGGGLGEWGGCGARKGGARGGTGCEGKGAKRWVLLLVSKVRMQGPYHKRTAGSINVTVGGRN